MRISSRLPLIIVMCTLISSIGVGAVVYWRAADALEQKAINNLVSLRESRAASFKNYLQGIEEDLALIAQSPIVKNALLEFTVGFNALGTSKERSEKTLKEYFNAADPAGNALGKINSAHNLYQYQYAHQRHHVWLNLLRDLKGYYDVFLVNAGGDVVYSATKEDDFATNLVTGRWNKTELARTIDGASDTPPNVKSMFADFKRHGPSADAPAGFISEPVYNNGRFIGVIALQMPIDRLNNIMHVTAGMGETGETYIVGQDTLMRSDSRFDKEPSILVTPVNTVAVDRALVGESGYAEMYDYRGIEVLAAYGPFDFKDTRWALMAEMDQAEVYQPIRELGQFIIIVVIITGMSVTLIGSMAARSVTDPLSRVRDAFEQFGRDKRKTGDIPGVKRNDELGDIARTFSSVADQVSEFIDEQESQAQQLESQVNERTQDLEKSQNKLETLVKRGIDMSGEQSEGKLFEAILDSAKELALADGGTLYLRQDDELIFETMKTDSLGIALGGATGQSIDLPPVQMYQEDGVTPNEKNVASHAAMMGQTVIIDDAYEDDRFDFTGTRLFDEKTGYRSKSFLTVPLRPRGKDVIGVLQLLNAQDAETGEVIPFDQEVVGFVEALAAQAAVALDNQNLIEAQKQLLDSFIELIASAIDAKSAYTGGHCHRVPEIAMMLAKEAADAKQGPFAEFDFVNEDEWREFRIGAWLHDCGKVTTPEYVVDKATKLETIYNRINEIRMRFEVLIRDNQIALLEAQLSGDTPDEATFEAEHTKLIEEFEFLAKCNIGGEYMDEEEMDRVRQIGDRSWTRHLNDRLGLSASELERFEGQPEQALPAVEKLLDDKPSHIVKRPDGDVFGDNPHGFDMEVPEHLYNYGEVYNLCIARGTLTNEERFKINDHIIQTIIMLNALPYPKHLQRIPEIAGNHHETMIGTGYPRKLSKGDMSIPSRIMAIADVFEALTASDRPYKAAKTLSESIKIMGFMKKDQHIDPELFDLFLTSGVYKEYAERYLLPEQLDEVDIQAYM